MAPWHRTAAFIWSTLAFLLYFGYTSAADPEHAINYFDNPPTRLFFFDDATVRHSYLPRGSLTNSLNPLECDIP